MKKTIAALLSGSMVAGFIPMASAASTLKDFMADNSIPTQYNIDVDADIELKESQYTTYSDGPIELAKTNASDIPTFDYKATLYMEKVRNAFSDYTSKAEALINEKGGEDKDALLAELDNLPVTGKFTVTINNADKMTIPDYMKNAANLVGFNDETKNIFKEESRTCDDTSMTIVISVAGPEDKGYVTKAELEENLSSYLADLTLSCDGVSVSDFGDYQIKGSITGYTNIGDDPATTEDESIAKITYNAVQLEETPVVDNGELSATVSVTKRSSGGGSLGGNVPSTPSFNITVETDGTIIDRQSGREPITYNPYDLDVPSKDNNLFGGWYNKTEEKAIEGSQSYSKTTEIEATWIPTGNLDISFVLDGTQADVNSKKENSVNVSPDSIKVDENGTTITVSDIDIVLPQGMKFDGWFLDSGCTTPADASMVVTEDTVLYGKTSKIDAPVVLDTENHYAYIIGYPDGTVKPQQNISREEVATIFFRLLTEDVRNEITKTSNDFTDVNIERWSNTAISTMEGYGLVTGYEDGSFRPAADITRAEFVAMAARFYEVSDEASSSFSDCSGHWAEKYIASASEKGWITGYEDNTFRPDQYITRAEAMTIVNNMLQRQVNAEGIHADAVQWTDNTSDAWYYYEVLEATNSHKCEERAENELNEKWTECIENFDWSTLEK